jgi:LacI family transcriptional regulator
MTAPPAKKITRKELAERCGVSPLTVWRVFQGMADVAPETAARVRAMAAEVGMALPEGAPPPPPQQPAGAVTLRMVAERAGVGVMTVSRVINDEAQVAPATAARVRQAAGELGYDPHRQHRARGLVRQRHGRHTLNRTLGVFLPPAFSTGDEKGYFGRLFDGIMVTAMEEEFSVVTSYTGLPIRGTALPDFALTKTLPTAYAHGDVDGAILMAGETELANVAGLLRAEPHFAARPLVTLLTPHAGASAVLTDDGAGAAAATAHLLELGHRQILHFWDSPIVTHLYSARLAGCRQAIRAYGLDPDACLHAVAWDWNHQEESLQSLLALLRATPAITAILAQQDRMAGLLYEVLPAAGFRIPEELSLVGFDDAEPIRVGRGENLLTSVRVPLTEVGQEGTRLLIRQILTSNPEPEAVTLPTVLVVRGTTAPARR